MCSADESTTLRQKNIYTSYTLAILFLNATNFIASLAYCLVFFPTDFDGAAFAFMVAAGEFGHIYFMIAAIRMRHQIDGIFTSMLTIYKNSKPNLMLLSNEQLENFN